MIYQTVVAVFFILLTTLAHAETPQRTSLDLNDEKTDAEIKSAADRFLIEGLQIAQVDSSAESANSGGAAGGAAAGQPSMAQLAQKANNPLSDVWLLLGQNDYTYLDGDVIGKQRQMNSFKFQPVMPVPIKGGEWNLIIRPIFNVLSLPFDDGVGDLLSASTGEIITTPALRNAVQDPYGRATGLGDSVFLTLVGPNRSDGFVWGVGATQIWPTASQEIFGQEKWQAGPAAIALRLGKESGGLGIENWNIGALVQQWWSYAGDDKRDDTSQMDIQYFLNWRLNDTVLIGMTPNIRVNWNADEDERLSFPIGIGTIGMFKIGRLPIRWGVEVQHYVIAPDSIGNDWNFKVFFSPVILNPLKK